MTTLYLVRHGATVDNARQIMQGQTQGELNATGISQAEALRDKLSDIHIDAFVSSDLYRSIQTCRILAQGRQVPMVETPLLRERDWGDFTGEYIPSLADREWPANVESAERLLARARNFLTWVRVTYPDQVVVAVGHGIINKAIQSVGYSGAFLLIVNTDSEACPYIDSNSAEDVTAKIKSYIR